ncbi:MAG: R3H domain-containing nucleic acid-binding protein [Candidatus Dormiibacterota bacterium]|jgi:spoIIIJ-associated protein
MSDQGFEGEGGTVAEATAAACRAAGLEPDAVMVEVISEGGSAVPGERISGARARVRVRAVPTDGLRGKRNLETMLRLMGIAAEVKVRGARAEEDGATSYIPLLLEVEGADLGILIGWRGESLRALQTVINLMLGDHGQTPGSPRLIVDVAKYRQRREQTVAQMALRMAAGVARSGRPVTLEPMQPYERRAVHLALASDASVSTESTGVDAERRVTIRPSRES